MLKVQQNPIAMKNPKITAIIYVIVGLVIALVSLFGYELGIARYESFGAFQMAGTLLGIVLLVLGLIRLMKKKQ